MCPRATAREKLSAGRVSTKHARGADGRARLAAYVYESCVCIRMCCPGCDCVYAHPVSHSHSLSPLSFIVWQS